MKRRDLLRHLSSHGCSLLREGGNHSWWHKPSQNKRSAVPRHNEINDQLASKICKDLVCHGHDASTHLVLLRTDCVDVEFLLSLDRLRIGRIT